MPSTDVSTLRVVYAGPHVSLQDAGRRGLLRFGVPRSGPMDRLAHAVANVAVGNGAGATAIEVSLAGITVECVGAPLTVSVAGGGFENDHPDARPGEWNVVTLDAGDRLSVRAGAWGSWCYLAVAGTIDAARWLDATATHTPSGFGGGTLRTGDEVAVRGARAAPDRDGRIPIPDVAAPGDGVEVTDVVLGPQDHRLGAGAVDTLVGETWRLSSAYDRMGVRLDGAALELDEALSIPSEPIVRGAVQVAGDGVPTVLLADHQTVGGYPKVAVVTSSRLDRFVQLRPGDGVRFRAVDADTAIRAARDHASAVDEAVESAATPTPNLHQRLRTQNLIGGVGHDTE